MSLGADSRLACASRSGGRENMPSYSLSFVGVVFCVEIPRLRCPFLSSSGKLEAEIKHEA